MKFSMFSASFEAHPLFASFYIISRIKVFVKNFFSTFWGVFSVHFHASQCLVYDVVLFLRVSLTAWLSYQRYTPLSTDFCIFFCLFLISFLRGFYDLSQEGGPAGPDPLQTLASSPLQEDPQGLRSSENIDSRPPIIMYENHGSGSESLQKSGFFHIPHTCPPAL